MPCKTSKPMKHVTIIQINRNAVSACFGGNTDNAVTLSASQLTKIFALALRRLRSTAKARKAASVAQGNKARASRIYLGHVYGPIHEKLCIMYAPKKG